MSVEVLQEIPDDKLRELENIYSTTKLASYISCLIFMSRKWRSSKYRHLVKFYAIDGNYQEDGTFILFTKCSCHDFYMFTKDDANCNKLCEAIYKTKLFNWQKYKSVLLGVERNSFLKVLSTLKQVGFPILDMKMVDVLELPNSRPTDLNITIPNNVYLSKLSFKDVETINKYWPHKYHNSDKDLLMLLEANGGIGVFRKSDNMLLSWVLQTHIGTLGILQTVDEHKRNGYGVLATKALCKTILQQNLTPVAPIIFDNYPSKNLMTNLGFEITCQIVFTSNKGHSKY